jgi:hypothetical protein
MEHDAKSYGRNLQKFQSNVMPSYVEYSFTLKIVEALNSSVMSVSSNILYAEFGASTFHKKTG